jgi:putative tricarboxylic transport membrane protein
VRRLVPSQLVLALALVAFGGFFIVEAQTMKPGPAYARVGPEVIPTIVGGITSLIGLALALVAARGGWPTGHETGPARQIGWAGLALISAGLLMQALLFERAGFVLSSTLLFVLVAAGFGSRAWLRDVVAGLALSLAAYLGFTRGLGLSLPPGVLDGLL